MMDIEKFIDQVRRLRQAQKAYFRSREKEWLVESRKREASVDAMLKEHYQLDLFQEKI